MKDSVEALDYGRSFVTFVTHGRENNARLQIESACRIRGEEEGEDYFFFASCKAEDTYAARNLFKADNYDFCGIFATAEYAIFRAHPRHSEGFRECGLWQERFADVRWHVEQVQARPLEDEKAIVQATLEGGPLIGVVEFDSPYGEWSARLEFPIKTMNVNDLEWKWQVDTGPVPFPDFGQEEEQFIEQLWPAYVAYNSFQTAEFIVQQPLDLGGGLKVPHYWRRVSLAAQSQVLAVE
jgi:hypothetical protein